MRSNTTERNIWAQLGLSACAVVLPPIALGAALYSMLSVRDEGVGPLRARLPRLGRQRPNLGLRRRTLGPSARIHNL